MAGEGAAPCLVVGLDGTTSSLRALVFAIGMAQRADGHLLAVTVVPEIEAPLGGLAGVAVATDVASQTGLPQDTVADLEERLPRRWHTVVVHGDAAGALIRAADDVTADAIVVGHPRHRGHHLFGSVPRRLLRHTRRPVIVVP